MPLKLAAMENSNTGKSGFALIIVLLLLLVITILFSISSSRMVAHLSRAGTDQLIAKRSFDRAALLDLASNVYARIDPEVRVHQPLVITWDGQPAELILQDVGGLVDLNTGQPDLLNRYFTGLGVSDRGIAAFWQWRAASNRVRRVADVERVAGFHSNGLLAETSTVHSGRDGFSTDEAPDKLLQLIGSGDIQSGIGPSGLTSDWSTPPSGVNYLVMVRITNDETLALGVIYTPVSGAARTLDIY